jgi:DUF883 C-terminal glycine zipper region
MSSEHELSLDEVSARVRKDAQLIGDALRREVGEIRRAAGDYVEQHPYQAAGAAFALGFLLSGGLISRTTWRSLRFASRFFAIRLLRELVSAAGVGVIFGGAVGGGEPVER